MHNEYQLSLKDVNYNDKIKDVTEKFTIELEQDRSKYNVLKNEKTDLEHNYQQRILSLTEKFRIEKVHSSFSCDIFDISVILVPPLIYFVHILGIYKHD